MLVEVFTRHLVVGGLCWACGSRRRARVQCGRRWVHDRL